MKILLIDSSSKKIEFAFYNKDEFVFGKQINADSQNLLLKKGHKSGNADILCYEIKNEFEKNYVNLNRLDVVSLSNGMGSFTGLRIGSAIVKGICYISKAKFVAIPTLDIMANRVKSDKVIVSLMPTSSINEEFYCGEYKYENLKLIRVKDFYTVKIEEIDVYNKIVVSNIELSVKLSSDNIITISNDLNMYSQYQLTLQYIKENKFSDYKISEPFYLSEFVPKLSSMKKN